MRSGTRTYLVMTGPVMVPVNEEYVIVVAPTEHTVYGKTIKYIAAPDAGQFQILDSNGDVVFATGVNMLLWFKVVQEAPEMGLLKILDSTHEEVSNGQV
jgi:N-acyl-D-aspartate/D-glutamate deacylase